MKRAPPPLPASELSVSQRKDRVEGPERCIRTRGIKAAALALAEHGPWTSLDKVAAFAGCPKASLARVFVSKEALLEAGLRVLALEAFARMKLSCQRAGGGRAGAFAAASACATRTNALNSHICPLNAASSSLADLPWAALAVREHKALVVAFYAQTLFAEMGEAALPTARAILLVCDGATLNAGAGFDPDFEQAALRALQTLLLLAPAVLTRV